AGGEQALEGAGLGDKAAAGGEHEARMALDRGLERRPLEAAEGWLAEHLEHLAEFHAARLFDLAIELDERARELGAQHLAERRLAAAAKADQRNPRPPRLARRAAVSRQQQLARFPQLGRGQSLKQLMEEELLDIALGPL